MAVSGQDLDCCKNIPKSRTELVIHQQELIMCTDPSGHSSQRPGKSRDAHTHTCVVRKIISRSSEINNGSIL